MLRLSLSTGTLYHLPLRLTFGLAHETEFDGVELVLGPEAVLRGSAYVQQLSRHYQLPVLSVHPPIVPHPGMNSPRRTLPGLVCLAEQLDCRLVVLHTPKVTTTENPHWIEFVQALQQVRSNPRVQVSLETGAFFRSSDARYLLHDARRLSAFAERYDLPVTFDTAHVGTMGRDLLQCFQLFNGRVANVHFSDLVQQRIFPNWRPLYTFLRHHQVPGDGVLPLAEFMRMLVNTGYSGILTLEISPTAIQAWNLARVRDGLANAVRFMRNPQ